MKTEFTPEELKDLFNNRTSSYYIEDARKHEQELRIHADGLVPTEMLKSRRPNEPEEVMTYREQIFVAKTKPYFSKIESALNKIRRSSDWSIKYPADDFGKITEGDKLEDYCESKYPVFGSVTNWLFSLLLRNYLIDPNGVVLVAPLEIVEGNNYLEPVATIFNSEDVIYFLEGDYCVLRNKIGVVGREGWESYYIVTTQYIRRYDQINNRKQFAVAVEIPHNLEEMPAFQIGAIVIDVYGKHKLYESRISGILPEFNEALREYSDLQAAKVLHLFPERWEYTQNECTKCKGTGQRRETTPEGSCRVTCDVCEGKGYIATGPYNKMLIRPVTADQLGIPTPPAGFVEKDVEIIKVQEESVQNHIYHGLASINFEFIASTPLNQSGTAKEVDRDDLNTTVHAIAEDLVRVMDLCYYFYARYRYSELYTLEEIKMMLPKIAVPEKFDILSTKYYIEELTASKNNKLNPAIINAMEVTYATKAFNNDLEIAEHVQLILKLDPLSGISEDDKMSRLSNRGITELDYIVSSNINKFVNIAIEDNTNFKVLDYRKQREIVYKMATDQMNETATEVINEEDISTDTEVFTEVR